MSLLIYKKSIIYYINLSKSLLTRNWANNSLKDKREYYIARKCKTALEDVLIFTIGQCIPEQSLARYDLKICTCAI